MWAGAVALLAAGSGDAHVLVAVDGHVAGVIVMTDELRPDALQIVERAGRAAFATSRWSLGTRSVAERIGRDLGVDRVYADQSPEDKLEVVARLRADRNLSPVIMVGDGVNDAPALALADLGIAMGVAGATVSSETADTVITVDRVDRVADAVHIGRRALAIARQSVLVGMALSLTAMAVAAFGYLPPVAGALLQEAIDLAVIITPCGRFAAERSAALPPRAPGRSAAPPARSKIAAASTGTPIGPGPGRRAPQPPGRRPIAG